MDELPRNPTGKILKRELVEREEEGDSAGDEEGSEDTADQTEKTGS